MTFAYFGLDDFARVTSWPPKMLLDTAYACRMLFNRPQRVPAAPMPPGAALRLIMSRRVNNDVPHFATARGSYMPRVKQSASSPVAPMPVSDRHYQPLPAPATCAHRRLQLPFPDVANFRHITIATTFYARRPATMPPAYYPAGFHRRVSASRCDD